MKIAFLVPDNREINREYGVRDPYFGTAPQGLLDGFAELDQSRSSTRNISDLEIHVISCTQQPMSAPEKLASNIHFHLLHVPKMGWLRTGYQGCIRAVRRKLAEIQPDLVHAQGTERDCAMDAVFSPYPRLLTIHGNLRLIAKSVGFKPFSAVWLQTRLEGFAVPRFDGVICITNYTRRAVEHEVARTWVVPNAVDPEFLRLGEERVGRSIHEGRQKSEVAGYSSLRPSPNILVVAHVDQRKNQNAFIRSLDPIAAKRGLCLKFFGKCGDDEYGVEFRRLVAERSWCEFGGMIDRPGLREQFSQAALVALPTHEDNCPMCVLEAQAAGVPVIASNVGGVPDLIEDGLTGLLMDPHDPGSMTSAVERVLSDAALANVLAANGFHQALTKFHPKVIASRHVEIYREVIKG